MDTAAVRKPEIGAEIAQKHDTGPHGLLFYGGQEPPPIAKLIGIFDVLFHRSSIPSGACGVKGRMPVAGHSAPSGLPSAGCLGLNDAKNGVVKRHSADVSR